MRVYFIGGGPLDLTIRDIPDGLRDYRVPVGDPEKERWLTEVGIPEVHMLVRTGTYRIDRLATRRHPAPIIVGIWDGLD